MQLNELNFAIIVSIHNERVAALRTFIYCSQLSLSLNEPVMALTNQ
jgi:hypothetical protein